MKNLSKIILSIITLATIGSTVLNADYKKGQTLYLKKLKKVCRMNGAEMAEKHTISQWEEINDNNALAKEIKSFCPKVKDKSIKEKFMIHYFDFFKHYGSDSGNIPSC